MANRRESLRDCRAIRYLVPVRKDVPWLVRCEHRRDCDLLHGRAIPIRLDLPDTSTDSLNLNTKFICYKRRRRE